MKEQQRPKVVSELDARWLVGREAANLIGPSLRDTRHLNVPDEVSMSRAFRVANSWWNSYSGILESVVGDVGRGYFHGPGRRRRFGGPFVYRPS